jgi:hypothetical protein
MDPLLTLALAAGSLHSPVALGRAVQGAHLEIWSLPALGAAILAGAAASAWAVLESTRTAPAVGQLWTDTGRAIRGLTVRITSLTPGRALVVVTSSPREALHDTTGRALELACGPRGLRGFRLLPQTTTP